MFGCGIGTSGYTGGFSIWMLVPMLFRIILLGVVIYFIFKFFRNSNLKSSNVFKILVERYASGEISFDEYQKMKENLNK